MRMEVVKFQLPATEIEPETFRLTGLLPWSIQEQETD